MSPVLHVEGCRTLICSVVFHHQLSGSLVCVSLWLSACPLYFLPSQFYNFLWCRGDFVLGLPIFSTWLALCVLMLIVWQARVGNSTLTCPAHVCHTCASEVRGLRLVRHSLNNFYVDFFIDIILKSSLQFWLFSSRLTLLLNDLHLIDGVHLVANCFKFTLVITCYII